MSSNMLLLPCNSLRVFDVILCLHPPFSFLPPKSPPFIPFLLRTRSSILPQQPDAVSFLQSCETQHVPVECTRHDSRSFPFYKLSFHSSSHKCSGVQRLRDHSYSGKRKNKMKRSNNDFSLIVFFFDLMMITKQHNRRVVKQR